MVYLSFGSLIECLHLAEIQQCKERTGLTGIMFLDIEVLANCGRS